VRPLLIAIFGWIAEQERTRLIERTKAGLEWARREGKRLGRPRLSPLALSAAAADVDAGLSRREAARRRGISESALRVYLPRAVTTSIAPRSPWLRF
jgi:DNA invertase Pin-like site-specific DNA recombinase